MGESSYSEAKTLLKNRNKITLGATLSLVWRLVRQLGNWRSQREQFCEFSASFFPFRRQRRKIGSSHVAITGFPKKAEFIQSAIEE